MKRGRQKFFYIEPSRTCKNRKLQRREGTKSLSLGYTLRIFQFGHAMPLPARGKAQRWWRTLCRLIAKGYRSSMSFGSFLWYGIAGTCSAASGGGWLETKLWGSQRTPRSKSDLGLKTLILLHPSLLLCLWSTTEMLSPVHPISMESFASHGNFTRRQDKLPLLDILRLWK